MRVGTCERRRGMKMPDETQQQYRDTPIACPPVDELSRDQQAAYAATVEAIRRVRYGSHRPTEKRTCGAIPDNPKELSGGNVRMRHRRSNGGRMVRQHN